MAHTEALRVRHKQNLFLFKKIFYLHIKMHWWFCQRNVSAYTLQGPYIQPPQMPTWAEFETLKNIVNARQPVMNVLLLIEMYIYRLQNPQIIPTEERTLHEEFDTLQTKINASTIKINVCITGKIDQNQIQYFIHQIRHIPVESLLIQCRMRCTIYQNRYLPQ